MLELIERIERVVNGLYSEFTSYVFSMSGKPVVIIDSGFSKGLEKFFSDLKGEYEE